jgi:hypothetical protein
VQKLLAGAAVVWGLMSLAVGAWSALKCFGAWSDEIDAEEAERAYMRSLSWPGGAAD